MKKLFLLFTLAFVAMSCEMIDEKLDDLLDKRDWVVFAEGAELSVDVPSKQTVLNYKFESTLDWEIKTVADWLEIDPMSGKAGKDIKIQIKVAKNKDKEGRTGYADLTLSNDESYRITINQAGESDENEDEDEDVIVDIPNNQIWYTSIDGEIVEPYSDEDDIHDNFTVFGANIISNEYDTEKECWVITFDSDVTEVGYTAFYDCDTLTSVTIPNSVTTIGEWAFEGCTNLTSVTLSDNLNLVGYGAFLGCDNLAEFKGKFVSEDDRCLIIDGTLYSFASAGLISYSIPDGVTTIGWYAFAVCSELISVTIPDSVVSIGYGAFESCTSITSITIPDSVILIEEGAFYGCSSLTSVTIGNRVATIEVDAFDDCINLMEFKGESVSEDGRCVVIDGELCAFAPAGITEYILPENVTIIGESVFSSCNNLTSVTIPNSVIVIGCESFGWCESLTSVIIGDNVTMIGSQAFYECSSLTSVTIPDSVTTISEGVFSWCESLTSITIPDSVTTIGEWAFADCTSLKEVYCKPTTPPAGSSSMFSSNASGRKIYVPMESVEAYKSAEGWSEYASDIVGYNF